MNTLSLSFRTSLKSLKIGIVAGFLIVGSGIADGARAGFFNQPSPEQKPIADDSPELQVAGQRVETARTNLDQARKQLDVAKAKLKAADAEFKAAKADKEALALRTQAQKLADDSGAPSTPINPVINQTLNTGAPAPITQGQPQTEPRIQATDQQN